MLDDRAHQKGDPLNPQLVAYELSPRLPDGAILTADSGSGTNWWAQYLKLRSGMKASLSGTLATMGCGVPYAIGAKFAFPDRPVIAMVGDGAFQMNGMNEMITVKRYWERWSNPSLVFCVFNNRDLNQVTWEQRAMAGDRKFEGSQSIPDLPYAEYARLVGLAGIRCDSPKRIGAAWEEALAADRPAVLEVVTDNEIPPVPPHIKKMQVKKVAQALRQRDPETGGITRKGAKQKAAEFTESLRSTLSGRGGG